MTRRGFTLIELMVALGITSFIVAGISIILVKQSQASVKQTQQRTLEETGRQALLELAYSVRMAGAGIDPTAAFDFDHYACGNPPAATSCNNNPGIDTPPTPASPGSRDKIDGPDELVVSYRNPTFVRTVTSISGAGPYTVTFDPTVPANALKTPLKQGRIVMLLCSGADPVSYMALSADAPAGSTSLTLRTVTDADGYYPQAAPTDNCFGKASLALVERVRYFVANDFDGVPALFRDRGRTDAPEVLFRGIEDLQLTYTIGPKTGVNGPVAGCGNGWTWGLCGQGVIARDPNLPAKPGVWWMDDTYDNADRFLQDPANIRSVQINLIARSSQLSPDRAGDRMPALANRPAPLPDPAHPYNRSVFTITEQTPNLLARARVMPAAGGT